MPTPLEAAIKKVKGAREHICSTQVYHFEDYDPATGDATSLCKRLGIPLTDDIIVEFPIERTFKPLSRAKIDKLSRELNASLPSDYTALLAEFGPFHLPVDSDIALFAPSAAIHQTAYYWHFTDPAMMPALAISHYNYDCDGDAVGYLRSGKTFGPELYHFKHEMRYKGDDPQLWTEKIAPSLSDFIISYLDSLS
jgi:hypothetical protein